MQLSPFKLERYFARYEFSAKYLLCSSDCESLAIQDLLALEPEAAEQFQQCWLGYTETLGAPALRRAICDLYTTARPENVLVHCGAGEGIFLFMQALLKAGDHLIVQWPCYQSLAEIGRGLGCEITAWTGEASRNWALDLDQFKRLLRPNTRAVVINLPHNPTGALMVQDDYLELHRIAQQRGVVLFSDEVYRESEYTFADRLPAACDLSELAVSLGVLSKTYGLAGLRIGWVATRNAPLLAKMAELKDYTTLCSSAPSEFLAELALRHRAQLARRNVELLIENLMILDEFFSRHQERFQWRRPQAGPVAFPRLLTGEVESFCHNLVEKAGVLLLPGTLYEDRNDHFRVGFGRKNLPAAVARLDDFLQTAKAC